jgi:hypothetical protein
VAKTSEEEEAETKRVEEEQVVKRLGDEEAECLMMVTSKNQQGKKRKDTATVDDDGDGGGHEGLEVDGRQSLTPVQLAFTLFADPTQNEETVKRDDASGNVINVIEPMGKGEEMDQSDNEKTRDETPFVTASREYKSATFGTAHMAQLRSTAISRETTMKNLKQLPTKPLGCFHLGSNNPAYVTTLKVGSLLLRTPKVPQVTKWVQDCATTLTSLTAGAIARDTIQSVLRVHWMCAFGTVALPQWLRQENPLPTLKKSQKVILVELTCAQKEEYVRLDCSVVEGVKSGPTAIFIKYLSQIVAAEQDVTLLVWNRCCFGCRKLCPLVLGDGDHASCGCAFGKTTVEPLYPPGCAVAGDEETAAFVATTNLLFSVLEALDVTVLGVLTAASRFEQSFESLFTEVPDAPPRVRKLLKDVPIKNPPHPSTTVTDFSCEHAYVKHKTLIVWLTAIIEVSQPVPIGVGDSRPHSLMQEGVQKLYTAVRAVVSVNSFGYPLLPDVFATYSPSERELESKPPDSDNMRARVLESLKDKLEVIDDSVNSTAASFRSPLVKQCNKQVDGIYDRLQREVHAAVHKDDYTEEVQGYSTGHGTTSQSGAIGLESFTRMGECGEEVGMSMSMSRKFMTCVTGQNDTLLTTASFLQDKVSSKPVPPSAKARRIARCLLVAFLAHPVVVKNLNFLVAFGGHTTDELVAAMDPIERSRLPALLATDGLLHLRKWLLEQVPDLGGEVPRSSVLAVKRRPKKVKIAGDGAAAVRKKGSESVKLSYRRTDVTKEMQSFLTELTFGIRYGCGPNFAGFEVVAVFCGAELIGEFLIARTSQGSACITSHLAGAKLKALGKSFSCVRLLAPCLLVRQHGV